MHRGLDEEDVLQKLAAHARVDDGARAGNVIERDVALKDDEHARAGFGHLRAGKHRLRDGVFNGRYLLRAGEGIERAQLARAELVDQTPDLRLEQHDQRERAEGQYMAQNEIDAAERQRIGKHQRQQKQQHDLTDAFDLRRSDELQKPVNAVGHQRDIKVIRHLEREYIAPCAFQNGHDDIHRHAPPQTIMILTKQ